MSSVREHAAGAVVALRWRPEWPIALIVLVAWIALLAGAAPHDHAPRTARTDAMQGHGMAAMHGHDTAATPGPHLDPMQTHAIAPDRHAPAGVLADLPDWTLMVVAMMAPVALPAVRHVGLNSIRRRRQWAMVVYFGVYVAVWVLFGVLALAVERVGRESGLGGDVLLVLSLTVAAAWQLSRPKRRALFQCRRTVPLPPVGLRADAGCARFALMQSRRCVTSCWALMIVMAVVGHAGLGWMAALAVLIGAEELTLVGRRLLRPSAAALALAAMLAAAGV